MRSGESGIQNSVNHLDLSAGQRLYSNGLDHGIQMAENGEMGGKQAEWGEREHGGVISQLLVYVG